MRLALRVGGFAVAVTIIGVLIHRLGAENIAAQLASAGPGFLWILVIHLFAMIAAALPWYVLLPPAARPTIGGAITSRFVASGANAALPLFGLGGEVARLLWLRKGERAPGVAAIIVDRLMTGAAAATLVAAGLIGLMHVPSLPAQYARAATVSMCVLVACVALGILLARRLALGTRLHRLVRRLRKQVDEDAHFGSDVDAHVTAMLSARTRGPWLAWLLHVLGRSLVGVEIYVGFLLLDVQLAWDQALVFAALPAILAVAGAFVPSQLGVHEGAQALVAASFGISTTTAVAVVLLLRLRQIAGAALIGILLLVYRGKLTPAQPVTS